MTLDPISSDARLRAVYGSGLLDTPSEEPFDRLAALARDLIGVPFVFVTVVDERRSFWKAWVGVDLEPGQATQTPVEESFCQYVVQDAQPLVLDDVRLDPRTRDNPSIVSVGVVAYAGFPVRSPDGQVLGTLCAVDTQPRQWSLMDVRILKTLALAASNEIALRVRANISERVLEGTAQDLDAARRLTSDAVSAAEASHQVSLTLQRSLLSKPLVEGMDLAVRYQTARGERPVGGDWYDAFDQPDGSTMLVIGDVSGHDIEAAAAMGQVRNFVRALGYDSAQSPAEVVRRTDRAMAGLRVPVLATAVVARLDPPAPGPVPGVRRLRWTNAGHPPPLVRHPDGTVEVLSRPHDLLLGVSVAADRADHEIELRPGSTVLLYTDGLVERPQESLQVSIDRLATALGDLGSLSLEEAADLLLSTTAPSSRDDVAIVLLRTP